MEDSLIIIFSMILAVLLMFLFPIMDTWERQDDISYMAAYSTVVEFVDSARNLGYVSKDMYDNFLQHLNATGNRYDITLEHRHRVYGKIADDESDDDEVYINSYKNYYTNEIEKNLAKDERYTMDAGDYFYVSVKNTNKTQSTLLKEVLYASPQEVFKIGVPYGGMVRNTGESLKEEFTDEETDEDIEFFFEDEDNE